jgi:hypothetical protein
MSEDRLARLEEQVARLTARIDVLERGQVGDGAPTMASPAPAADPAAVPIPSLSEAFSVTRALFLLGRSILILAGGFLLRALSESGTVPPPVGFGLGLAYSLGLILVAHWFAGRDDRLGSGVLGLTAAVLAYPFLTESITKLALVSPLVGGLSLALVTTAGLWTAWSRGLRFLAWVFGLASLLALVGLGFTAGAPELFALLLLPLCVASAILAYSRRWHIMRWPVGITTNFVFLRLTYMATTAEGLGSGVNRVSAPQMLALDLALLLVYLGIFSYRALVQGKGVKVFDVAQSAFVLAVGFGGAVHIASVTGHGVGGLGWMALLAAVAGYSVAFTVVRTRLGRGRGFFYFASLALVFLVLGSRVVASGPWLAWCLVGLGLMMAILGSRFDRVTLRIHSIIYLLLASLQSGMMAAAVDAFAGSAGSVWRPMTVVGATNLAMILASYTVFVTRQGRDQDLRSRRSPSVFLAVLALLGVGNVVIVALTRMLSAPPPDAAPAIVAVIRTAVLSLTVVGLALVARREKFREMVWLVYPLLALGCLKLLLEDLHQGSPLTLFVAFGFFGTALIMAPRLVNAARRSRDS